MRVQAFRPAAWEEAVKNKGYHGVRRRGLCAPTFLGAIWRTVHVATTLCQPKTSISLLGSAFASNVVDCCWMLLGSCCRLAYTPINNVCVGREQQVGWQVQAEAWQLGQYILYFCQNGVGDACSISLGQALQMPAADTPWTTLSDNAVAHGGRSATGRFL